MLLIFKQYYKSWILVQICISSEHVFKIFLFSGFVQEPAVNEF